MVRKEVLMSFSLNNQCHTDCINYFLPIFFAVGSVSIYSSSFSFIALLLAAFLLCVLANLNRFERISIALILTFGCFDVLDPSFSITLSCIFALPANSKRLLLSFTITQFAFYATLVCFISEFIPSCFSQSIPLVLVIVAYYLVFRTRFFAFILFATLFIAFSYIANYYSLSFVPFQILFTLIFSIFISFLCCRPFTSHIGNRLFYSCLLACLIIDCFWLWPKFPSETVFFLKTQTGYFENYQEILNFSGIKAHVTNDISFPKKNAFVIVPDLSVNNYTNKDLDNLRTQAISKNWTVILLGEHNNLNDVSSRISYLTGQHLLADDLMVPRQNTNNNGLLRSGSLFGWNPKTEINRGATPLVSSLLYKVLLSSDDWWRESTISSKLWVGDFIKDPSDKSGRLPIVISSDSTDVRWVVVSDSSPFLNSFVITSPSSIKELIFLSTYIPVLLKDFLLFFLLLFCVKLRNICEVSLLSFLVVSAFLYHLFVFPRVVFSESIVDSSAFDITSFNKKLIMSKKLLSGQYYIKRNKFMISEIEDFDRPLVLFAHVSNNFNDSGIRITNCKRLGNIRANQITLMDAQACSVFGDVDVLIGDTSSAAAVRFNNRRYPLILILDTNFLSQNSPKSNLHWLESVLFKN